MKKVALITGITGQDGSILADYLLLKNYQVYGLVRRVSGGITSAENIKHLIDNNKITLIEGDISDQNSILRALKISQPNELYHLAAQSHVGQSFKTPESTANITGLGTLRVLEALRQFDSEKKIRMYNSSSSEQFGKMIENPANENTPFYPRSPYGVSKVFSYYMTKNYRESYDMHCSSGIMFNHQSFRRGKIFLPKKITSGIKDIIDGKIKFIELGNIEAKRDWGAAEKYIEAMHLILQQEVPDDYIVATGQTHSVKEFLEIAFKYVDINNWQDYIKINPKFYRPAEVDVLRGDASKIKKIGWKYNITFEELIHNMIDQEFGKPNRFI